MNTGLKLSQALTHPLHHDLQLYQITVPGSYKGDLSSSGTDKNVAVRMGPCHCEYQEPKIILKEQ